MTEAEQALADALACQAATSEILAVISTAPRDLSHTGATILKNATRLCDAQLGNLFVYDGDAFHAVAHHNASPQFIDVLSGPLRPGPETGIDRLLASPEPFQLADVRATPTYRESEPYAVVAADLEGIRTLLGVPLVNAGRLVGIITIYRREILPFTDKQVELVRMFADQAVIAITNARLIREIDQKSAQLEAANRHKSEFLANMSHELRTPLNAVIGFSDVLLEGMFGEINDKQREYLGDILASGKHLLSLINDILDLSKIEAGRMELDLAEFDAAQAIGDALLLMRERATRDGIALGQDIDRALGRITADERKFKQVLLNLLSNAVKFTPPGGRVDVRARLVGDGLEVAVSDSGDGISPEDQRVLFQEFRQVGRSARRVEGTGLGLALCRKFVELHGGIITVASAPGTGSTFTFTVPGVGP